MKLIKYFNRTVEDSVLLQICEEFKISKIFAQLLIGKGYTTGKQIADFLNSQNLPLINPLLLKNLGASCEKIWEHINQKSKILIFGDYDVDGISASYILLEMFKKLGVEADYFLPNRFVDGYGLSCSVVDKICEKFNPNLVITVDCGITAHKEVEYMQSKGVDVIVTDHHEIADIIPNCLVVNTKFEDQEYEFRGLCGAGVAYKVAQQMLGDEQSEFLLPIVAIATIADIVPLVDENRVLVKKGMSLMEKHLPFGLKQLFAKNKLNLKNVNSADISFKIGPKLNASGRLGEASLSLKLMQAKNQKEANELIDQISLLNSKRQQICNEVYDECLAVLNKENISTMPSIILKSENWDGGILGIVCSRLVEKFRRPVLLFSQKDGILKGSGRSMEDVNIHELLKSVSDILEVYGGHKVAAGLTIKEENFEEFRRRVFEFINKNVNPKSFMPVNYYDMKISSEEIDKNLIEELKMLEPCGTANSKPLFLIESEKVGIFPLKSGSLHANIHIDNKISLIFFGYTEFQEKLNYCTKLQFVFELQEFAKNMFKGIVKAFVGSPKLKEQSQNFLDCFKMTQLLCGKSDLVVKEKYYDDLSPFVVNLSKSVWGTCFVCFKIETYLSFLSKYSIENIYDISIFSNFSFGANCISLFPADLSFLKHYNNIVFLDAVMDKTFLQKVRRVSNAEIYLPNNSKENLPFLKTINLNKTAISKFAEFMNTIQNMPYSSLINLHSKIVRDYKYKISFNNFLAYFYILHSIKALKVASKDGVWVFECSKNNFDVTNSNLYNRLKFLGRLYE